MARAPSRPPPAPPRPSQAGTRAPAMPERPTAAATAAVPSPPPSSPAPSQPLLSASRGHGGNGSAAAPPTSRPPPPPPRPSRAGTRPPALPSRPTAAVTAAAMRTSFSPGQWRGGGFFRLQDLVESTWNGRHPSVAAKWPTRATSSFRGQVAAVFPPLQFPHCWCGPRHA